MLTCDISMTYNHDRPASEVPGGTGCSVGNTKGDMLTGMMARIVAAIEK